jgi:hypothetical protein
MAMLIGLTAAAPENKDPTRNPANTLFDGTGMFINSADSFPAKRFAAKMKMAGVTWIAVQIDNGGKIRQDTTAALDQGWADAWRSAGFKVGFWGCPRGVAEHGKQSAVDAAKPLAVADAELAVKLSAKYHADLYLADVEDTFQRYTLQDSTPLLNRVYVEAFQRAAAIAGISDMPRAMSSEGRIALDMKPWIDNGWDAMPQAYWNAYAVYQPSKCVDFYASTGWPIARIHPTIGTFPGEGEKRNVSLAEYDKDLRARPTTGFSFYLPESYLHEDSEYQFLAKMGLK